MDYLDGALDELLDGCETPPQNDEERKRTRAQWWPEEWSEGDCVWTRKLSRGGDSVTQFAVRVEEFGLRQGT